MIRINNYIEKAKQNRTSSFVKFPHFCKIQVPGTSSDTVYINNNKNRNNDMM